MSLFLYMAGFAASLAAIVGIGGALASRFPDAARVVLPLLVVAYLVTMGVLWATGSIPRRGYHEGYDIDCPGPPYATC